MKTQLQSVRLWVWWNDTLTRITAKQNKPIYLYHKSRTEEGWESLLVTYLLEDGVVYSDIETDGTDCDGRLSTQTRWTTTDFASHVPYYEEDRTYNGKQILLPVWQKRDESQRDYQAEDAGY
jgi:hypothetical protein